MGVSRNRTITLVYKSFVKKKETQVLPNKLQLQNYAQPADRCTSCMVYSNTGLKKHTSCCHNNRLHLFMTEHLSTNIRKK